MREFYALYGGLLAAVCERYVVDAEDVKDVLQDAMVQIFSHRSDFHYRGPGSLRAWAVRIAVNQSLQFLRTVRRHEWVELQRDVAEEPEADDPPIAHIPPEEIQRMVSQLPTGYRTVFNLYVFEDKSHQEIARMLGI